MSQFLSQSTSPGADIKASNVLAVSRGGYSPCSLQEVSAPGECRTPLSHQGNARKRDHHGHSTGCMEAMTAHANAPHRVHTGAGNVTYLPRTGATRAEKPANRRVGMLPMRNASRHGEAPQDDGANPCISNICHTAPGDERPPLAETFCGKVSLVMFERVQALPHLAFPLSMEPPLVFWYDKPQWMRTVE